MIYRHFPLSSHAHAQKAAEASEAAGAQGQFFAYHDALYDEQIALSGVDGKAAREHFIKLAEDLGLDVETFTQELDDGVYTRKVQLSGQEAIQIGMPGTPALLINGQVIGGSGLPSYEILEQYVESTVATNALLPTQYDAPPAMMINEKSTYQATIEMESGDNFIIEMYPESAPQTVNNFVFLANEGWFDGITFHRVVAGFVAQTGDPSGTGRGGPGYLIPNEIDPSLSHDKAGMVAMANSGPDTNGSQWYITLAPTTNLDGAYTVFGRVISGMETVEAITVREPVEGAPLGDVITSITVEEVRE